MGYDLLTETLMIVEETPSRIFTRRPILSLLLTLLAVLFFVGVTLCLAAPERVTVWVSGMRPR